MAQVDNVVGLRDLKADGGLSQTSVWVGEYLRALNLELKSPSLDYLTEICTHHLRTFPFENISKMIYYRGQQSLGWLIPPVEDFVANHDRFDFGGTCYTLNSNLFTLLQALGFDGYVVKLGGVHMGILVSLPEFPGERFYVDCGAAAPFFRPVRFETNPDNVTKFGIDEIRIRPVEGDNDPDCVPAGAVAAGGASPGAPADGAATDACTLEHGNGARSDVPASARYVYTRYMNGDVSGTPWSFDANAVCYLDDFASETEKANQPGATFMTILRCQIWQPDRNRSVSLVNNVLSIRYSDGRTDRQILPTADAIEAVLRDEFNLPKLPVRDAIAVLDTLGVDVFKEAN